MKSSASNSCALQGLEASCDISWSARAQRVNPEQACAPRDCDCYDHALPHQLFRGDELAQARNDAEAMWTRRDVHFFGAGGFKQYVAREVGRVLYSW